MEHLREDAMRYFKGGDYVNAAQAAAESLAQRPEDADMLSILGVSKLMLGDFADAARILEDCVRLAPGNPQANFNCGLALENSGCGDKAQDFYNAAIALQPDYVAPRNNLAGILCKLGHLSLAERTCREGLALSPDSTVLHCALADVLNAMGQIPDAIKEYEDVVASREDSATAFSDLLLCLLYMDSISPRSIYERHVAWAARYERPLLRPPPAKTSTFGRRLRVGYLSGDFKRHSVAFFIEPVLACHNKNQFETFCYSDSARSDLITERFKSIAENWREIASLSDEQVAEAMRADQLDILFDLAGHTGRRLRVFAMKPAPTQISWIGYPATTGLSSIDYRISDVHADPPGAEAFHTERLLRLPDQFLVFSPPDDAPPVGEAPCLRNGHLTFGSFNSMPKISDRCVALWASALKTVPESRLLLKNKALRDDGVRQRLLARFAREGVSPYRVRLLPFENSFSNHLETYSMVDVALDSYPYHGTTTTCEAMWMGVPTISLLGDRHCSRVALSLLSAVGLPSLAVNSQEEFAGLAQALTSDLGRLAAFKASLRNAMASSALCDAKRFTVQFEAELACVCAR